MVQVISAYGEQEIDWLRKHASESLPPGTRYEIRMSGPNYCGAEFTFWLTDPAFAQQPDWVSPEEREYDSSTGTWLIGRFVA
jgi:hypothetical protein